MIKKLKEFQKEFPDVKVERLETRLEDESYVSYRINGLRGNSNLTLHIHNSEQLDSLSEILRKGTYVFDDFLAIHYENRIEVLLTSVTPRTLLSRLDVNEDESKRLFEIGLSYYKNELNIAIDVGKSETMLAKLAALNSATRMRHARKPKILVIENFTKSTSEGIENDTRNIINSVLFDIEYTYGYAFETVNVEGLSFRSLRNRRNTPEIPTEKIELIFKKYVPELIQYFHIAEKVDFVPFKFICYYHIIEYFSDKSAHKVISSEIQRILRKPDFHSKIDAYVDTAIRLFKRETEKTVSDKLKIERVLKQYIDREELKEALTELAILDNFTQEVIIDCSKPLRLPGVNFDQDGNFYGDLTKRIYSLRCSIVHSNPDFDESKGIPFNPTPTNIDKLRTEVALVSEIARKIIVDSSQ